MGDKLSIVHGMPLAEEPGQGTQTIAGYLREVAARYGSAEALVSNEGGQRVAWSPDGTELLIADNSPPGSARLRLVTNLPLAQ